MVKIKQLIKDLKEFQVKGSKEVEISGLSSHSKKVAPGDLFFAKKGTKAHGLDFVKDAFLSGAKAIVTDLYNPFFKDKTQIVVNNVAEVEPILAKKFYQDPSKDLFLVGITGTNGKTTTAYLIQHLLSTKSVPCGLIGTVEVITGKNRFHSTLTTPDSITLNKYLREMNVCQLKGCVMEVSSHALDQNRIAGIDFDHVIFTNFTQDHLDYHGSMESYLKSKQKLFTLPKQLKNTSATVNIDDPFASDMIKKYPTSTVSLKDPKATFFCESFSFSSTQTEITVLAFGKKYNFTYSLVGKFNVYNVLEAISCAFHAGISFSEIEKRLKTFTQVPGRLQLVQGADFPIYVDFAHTEDSLKQVLKTLKELNFEKIILVFGCGGDRDQGKRVKMGEIAARYASYTIITADNPRNEDPLSISEMIISGMDDSSSKEIIIDRKEAISRALSIASKKDCVLIAGKGHEAYQIFQNKTIEFSDIDEVKKLLINK